MKESKKISNWKFQDSDLWVPPEILIEHAKKNGDPLITTLLERSDDDDDTQSEAGLLRSRLELLLNDVSPDDSEKQREKEELLDRLVQAGLLPSQGVSTRRLSRELQGCRDKIFDRKVRYATCHPFPPELAVLVNLTFLPDEFFSPTDHPEMKKHYDKMVVNQKSAVGSFRTSMNWGAASNYGCGFQFGGKPANTECFVNVLEYFLTKYGGKDTCDVRSSPSLLQHWSLGFLSTVLERLQDPHMDYEHKMLAQYKRMTGFKSRNKKGDVLLPWSFDLPLTDGGLRLAFYGIDDPNHPSMLLETPVELYVPPKHVVLWRGDCLHAGSLLDNNGRSGFRMHGCLPLAPGHVGCGKDAGAKIEWHGPGKLDSVGGRSDRTCGVRYSKRLKKLDGTDFEEDDEVRFAADVVEKCGLESQTIMWKLGDGERSKRARLV